MSGRLELSGTLLFFGGPYSNLQATEALRAEAQRLGIPAGNVVCTGDVVAYCGQPNETVACLRDWGVRVVKGNCEESLATGAGDCGCGFTPGSACDLLSVAWYRHADACLRDEHRAWMRTLPARLRFAFDGRRYTVVHGSCTDISRFVFASTEETVKQAELAATGDDGIVAGHCGLPFTQHVGDRLWHNPGVIGMPANDGTARVWYSLWRPTGTGVRIEHRALRYDAASAIAAMHAAGLRNGYADALGDGRWPSVDVLPVAERTLGGVPLEQSSLMLATIRAGDIVRVAEPGVGDSDDRDTFAPLRSGR